MAALCVECDAELNLTGRVRLGQRIVCPNCGIQLEIISLRPIEVDVAYDDSEEWDDLDGYGLEDEEDLDDLDELARLEGNSFKDAFDDELLSEEEDFEDEALDDELDDFDEEDEDRIGRRF